MSEKSSAGGQAKSPIPIEHGDNPPTATNMVREELHQLSPQIAAWKSSAILETPTR